MNINNNTQFNADTHSNIHIINRTSGKNCSTSSTDSGVGLVDNHASEILKAGPTTAKDNRNFKSSWQQANDETTATTKNTNDNEEAKTETNSQRISIEVEATVNLENMAGANGKSKASKTSPALSIRSTTISIVSIDENAIDSSCIDSDSDAEPDDGCTVQKLGQQISNPLHPPHSEQLTELNRGLTVISRQVTPESTTAPDVVAKQVLNGNLGLATPTNPSASQQIGSIALTNTTDVTFGDKHYYEGPVTIQQILIDSRDKWKDGEVNGHENPAFNVQASANGNAPGNKIDEACAKPSPCPFLPNTISRRAMIITATIVVLTILLGVILGKTTNLFGKTINKRKLGDGDDSRQNIPINSTIDSDNIGGGLVLRFVPRSAWLAQPPQKQLADLSLPVPMVIVLPTNSENCSTQAQCVFRVRLLQTFHIESQQRDDISYNFLIGGDGNVYVGRGWDQEGAHMRGYNARSVSLAYIGYFRHLLPSPKQLSVTRLLLNEGVNLGKLAANYKLVGGSTLAPTITEYNAEKLYQTFANWTHWSTQV